MYNFRYVTEKQLSPVKNDLILIMNSVRAQLCKEFTFQFEFIGSAKRNMVTYDEGMNIGFDFDVNIQINANGIQYSAKDIRTKIRTSLDKIAPHFGYDHAEDSTRVITIKLKDKRNSKILHSADFAIVNNYIDKKGNKQQRYIRFHKKHSKYVWEKQPKKYYLLEKKVEWVRNEGFWNEVRKLYLEKKNRNTVPGKCSQSIYAETIHEICQKRGYYE
ncbi:hypothetical protein D7X88_15100 [bacterium C-53]|nr:hypothetical protein [Lachnospiraceae bacterium]NBI02212.1 hypothetical protein [Lachnospiraceae bacterium]RKJ08391.1 hypothetical protein D7X88_15100 [bacterium C-53]